MSAVAAVFGVADLDRILEIAQRLPVFPCRAKAEIVGGKLRNAKSPHTDRGFHDASQDEAQIRAWWRQWPDALVGVPTGQGTGLVVIDYDPDKATQATHSWMAEHSDLLTSTRVHTTGRAGKHYVFRSRDRYQTGTDLVLGGSPRRGIDLRANGGYVIWWPAHLPQTDDSPVAVLPAGLIEERRFEAARDLAPLPTATPASWRADRPKVAEALSFLDAGGYDPWIRAGMAIHSASGGSDEGFALWHEWSATGNTYDGIEDCRYHWQSFGQYQGRSLGIGSLIKAAQAEGMVLQRMPELPAASTSEAAPEPATAEGDTLATVDKPARHPLNWASLEADQPPPRVWALPHWLGRGYLTLMAGPGGVGKTLLAQQLGSALAVGDPFIETPLSKMKVLMWAGEDDRDELWRRQMQIASFHGRNLAEYHNLIIESYVGRDCSLAEPIMGALRPTSMLAELEEQVSDYEVDVVILDNVARLYGGNENDRHCVTQFVNWVTGACMKRRPTAILLLAHPAKATGSEYSGSSAWEAAVRSRWYFGRSLPDEQAKEPSAIDADTDPNARVLARRKSNYSGLDTLQMQYSPNLGLLTYDTEVKAPDRLMHPARAEGIVLEALAKLQAMGVPTSAAPRANNFLITEMRRRGMLQATNKAELTRALYRLQEHGRVVMGDFGRGENRHKRTGLMVKMEDF